MWRLKIGLYSALTLFVIQAAVLMSAKVIYTDELDDPLVSFATIKPGQSLDQSELDWCDDYEIYYEQYAPEDLTRICHMLPDEGVVQSVSIYVWNGTIQRVTYHIGGLTVGGLALLWGRPVIDIEEMSSCPCVYWVRGEYTVTVPLGSRKFSYWLLVDSLITNDIHESGES